MTKLTYALLVWHNANVSLPRERLDEERYRMLASKRFQLAGVCVDILDLVRLCYLSGRTSGTLDIRINLADDPAAALYPDLSDVTTRSVPGRNGSCACASSAG